MRINKYPNSGKKFTHLQNSLHTKVDISPAFAESRGRSSFQGVSEEFNTNLF